MNQNEQAQTDLEPTRNPRLPPMGADPKLDIGATGDRFVCWCALVSHSFEEGYSAGGFKFGGILASGRTAGQQKIVRIIRQDPLNAFACPSGPLAAAFSLLFWLDTCQTRRNTLASDVRSIIENAFADAGVRISLPHRAPHSGPQIPLHWNPPALP